MHFSGDVNLGAGFEDGRNDILVYAFHGDVQRGPSIEDSDLTFGIFAQYLPRDLFCVAGLDGPTEVYLWCMIMVLETQHAAGPLMSQGAVNNLAGAGMFSGCYRHRHDAAAD